MKKAISFIFLLLANMVLLAHSVMHHHQVGIDAVTHLECHHTQNHLDYDHAPFCCHGSHSHQDQEEDGVDNCTINDTYTRTNNDTKITCFEKCDCDGHSHYYILAGALDISILLHDTGTHVKPKPYLIICSPTPLLGSVGLRAPPSC